VRPQECGRWIARLPTRQRVDRVEHETRQLPGRSGCFAGTTCLRTQPSPSAVRAAAVSSRQHHGNRDSQQLALRAARLTNNDPPDNNVEPEPTTSGGGTYGQNQARSPVSRWLSCCRASAAIDSPSQARSPASSGRPGARVRRTPQFRRSVSASVAGETPAASAGPLPRRCPVVASATFDGFAECFRELASVGAATVVSSYSRSDRVTWFVT
jgi:hypothetical protein